MIPSKIRLHKQSRKLELQFGAETLLLSAEFLRVHSPSAEVKGHSQGQAILQYGKREVAITQIERAGNYAIKLVFDDGHDTGIYTWEYLYHLGIRQETLWQIYLDELHRAGKTRDANTSVVRLMDPP